MTHTLPPEHFEGKSVSEHLKAARQKGAYALSEMHGSQLPGHRAAAAEGAIEISICLLLLWILGSSVLFLGLFSLGWIIWKTGRSATLGWAKLDRLHRVIEEERWEIEHHREQEKEELKELYKAKGFQGKLLNDAVDVMMADDNRLLKIMLEEEMGLTLETLEHPLKQAVGAFLGTLAATIFILLIHFFLPLFGLPLASFIVIATATFLSAHFEKRKALSALVWNLSLAFLCGASLYLIKKFL